MHQIVATVTITYQLVKNGFNSEIKLSWKIGWPKWNAQMRD